jgi:hypothetical protein
MLMPNLDLTEEKQITVYGHNCVNTQTMLLFLHYVDSSPLSYSDNGISVVTSSVSE